MGVRIWVLWVSVLVVLALSGKAWATTFTPCNNSALATAASSAQPGDTIIMCDGTWTSPTVTFANSGTAGNPITLRAQTPGAVIITGATVYFRFTGNYWDVSGLQFKRYGDPNPYQGHIHTVNDTTGSVFHDLVFWDDTKTPLDGFYYFNIEIRGVGHEVRHVAFMNKTSRGAQLITTQQGTNRNHWFHHLYFHRKPYGFDAASEQINGGESLQLGAHDGTDNDADDIVADHLFFDGASGESEIISLKGNRQTVSEVVMLGCNGTINFRFGSNNIVRNVYIDGRNTAWAGGISFELGTGHLAENIFMKNTVKNWIGTIYFPSGNADGNVTNSTVRNVTIKDSVDTMSVGTVSAPHPTGLAFDNIVIDGTSSGTGRVLFVNGSPTYTFTNSYMRGTANISFPAGITVGNPQLISGKDGIWYPDPTGAAANKGASLRSWPVYRRQTGPQTYSYNMPGGKAGARQARP